MEMQERIVIHIENLTSLSPITDVQTNNYHRRQHFYCFGYELTESNELVRPLLDPAASQQVPGHLRL